MLIPTNEPPIRILIACDHPIFQDALGRLLDERSGFQVIGPAVETKQAAQAVGALRPDVLLLDLATVSGGLKAVKALRTHMEPVRVLALASELGVDSRLELVLFALNHPTVTEGSQTGVLAEAHSPRSSDAGTPIGDFEEGCTMAALQEGDTEPAGGVAQSPVRSRRNL